VSDQDRSEGREQDARYAMVDALTADPHPSTGEVEAD
jgi:hypothetical protein